MKHILLAAAILLSAASQAKKSPITNIIVLMMENRSFDHLLGWMKADKNPDIEGLSGGETVPRDPNDPSKGSVPITRNGYDVAPDDPPHSFDNVKIQINSNGMDGFVHDAIILKKNETNPVSMFDQSSAPIINMLASEFAVFDHWHCSIPGPTDPNRAFAMSGTAGGILTNFNGTLYSQQSYFDYLRTHGRTFAGYYQKDMWALYFFEDTNKPENSRFIHDLDEKFYVDVAAGNLPQFTWLQPQMSALVDQAPTWQHPDASVQEGERLIKKIYEAIRAGPKWDETLFIITYDEHGGFYDHVVPPYQGVPAPDSNVAANGFAFNQLGVRIPTIAISPWIAAGTVVSHGLPNEMPTPTSQFDSTSILATANKILGLSDEGVAPLGERMAWANTFAGLLDMQSEPRKDCLMTLSELPEVDPASYQIQRNKPINDHIESQLIFFCLRNHPTEHEEGRCPGRAELMLDQGMASDWMAEQTKKYRMKLVHMENMADLQVKKE